MSCMDEMEQAFLDDAISYLKTAAPESATELEHDLSRVEGMATMFHSFPSILDEKTGDSRKPYLVDILCQVDAGMSAFSLPMRAVLGDAFLTAKIKLFQAFRDALQSKNGGAPHKLVACADREAG